MTTKAWGGRLKQLKYRDQSGSPQEVHQEHWRGFTFEAGPVIVAYVGNHGTIQVWAASEAEGRRVIEHACAVAAIPTTGEGSGEWIVTQSTSSRNGKGGTFQVAKIFDRVIATKRDGPSGQPTI